MTQTSSEEINLRQTLKTLGRYSPLIVGLPVVMGLGAYLYSDRIPPTYQSTATVMSVSSQAGDNSLINSVLVSAPPLPDGVVEKALHSKQMTEEILRRLRTSGLDAALLQKITSDLNAELAANRFNRIRVRSELNFSQGGIYEFAALAETPEAARRLAQAAMDSTLAWDKNRAQGSATLARKTYEAQLRDLTLQESGVTGLSREALINRRGAIEQNIRQAQLLEEAAVGTLQKVADPVAPNAPVSPRRIRMAVTAGLFGLLLALVLAMILNALRRRITDVEDVEALGQEVLGQLPRLKPRELKRGVTMLAQGGGSLYESLGYLRVNLLRHRANQTAPGRFLITSTRPGEGKSTVAASLAASFANSGMKVLVIDADLHRPTQHRVWRLGDTNDQTLVLSDVGHGHAGRRPVQVAEHIDLIPAGRPSRDASQILNDQVLGQLLSDWQDQYDVVLIDTPPLLALADALNVAADMDGVILVVEAGQTHPGEVQRALRLANNAGATMLGVVLNKVPPRSNTYAYYGYNRTSAEGMPSDLS